MRMQINQKSELDLHSKVNPLEETTRKIMKLTEPVSPQVEVVKQTL